MNPLAGLIQRFGVGRLIAILGGAAGVAAALAAIVMHLGAAPKALLYSNLDLKEAGSITQALDQAGIRYEVKGDGSTILVDRDKVASTRLMLSGKGLPTSGSVGYEIFDNAPALGQTDFVQNLNRQRALEGDELGIHGGWHALPSPSRDRSLPIRTPRAALRFPLDRAPARCLRPPDRYACIATDPVYWYMMNSGTGTSSSTCSGVSSGLSFL